jgi:hypothetical protein
VLFKRQAAARKDPSTFTKLACCSLQRQPEARVGANRSVDDSIRVPEILSGKEGGGEGVPASNCMRASQV